VYTITQRSLHFLTIYISWVMEQIDYWKPTSIDFIENPHPSYEKLRELGPIFKAKSGDFVITSYDTCKKVLKDPSFISGQQNAKMKSIAALGQKKNKDFTAIARILEGMIIQINNPLHSIVRSQLIKAWPTSAQIKGLIDDILSKTINELPDSFEAMESLCKKIPVMLISKLLGIPVEYGLKYMDDGLNVVRAIDPYLSHKELQKSQQSAERLLDYIGEFIKTNNHTSDLTKAVLNLAKNEDEADAESLLAFMFVAGYETTSFLLASCLIEMIEHPEYIGQIKEKGALAFVKEVLRIHSPVQITGRSTTQDVKLGGIEIPENAILTLCLGAANTDPTKFKDPLKVDLSRSKFDHLAFGNGMRHCLGNRIAEMEAVAFVESLLGLVPKIRLRQAPKYQNKFAVRGYDSIFLEKV